MSAVLCKIYMCPKGMVQNRENCRIHSSCSSVRTFFCRVLLLVNVPCVLKKSKRKWKMKLLLRVLISRFPFTAELSHMQLFHSLQGGICSVCSYRLLGHGFSLPFKVLIPLKLLISFCLLLFSVAI